MLDRATIEAALMRMLYPLVSFLIDHGVTESHFSHVARKVFVKAGAEKISQENRSAAGKQRDPTASAVAVLTGVPRKKIDELLYDSSESVADDEWYRHRCAKVLSQWWGTAEYLDDKGTPITIRLTGDAPSFEALAQMSGKDIYFKYILDELKSAGSVIELEDGTLQVQEKIFRRSGYSEETLQSIADTYYNLGATIREAKLSDNKSVYQEEVFTLRAKPEQAAVLLRQIRESTGKFLSKEKDRLDQNSLAEDAGEAVRIGVGAYVFKDDEMAQSKFFARPAEGEDKKVSNE
ncbi:MAG: hypothetical protein KJP16_06570 [Gammaproteobacteria bacterium]|nr:hypothetical protein [Gammaproteobacteria bacterium]NNL50468.1 hypothetical protein [Woeseiaceae bacterium]